MCGKNCRNMRTDGLKDLVDHGFVVRGLTALICRPRIFAKCVFRGRFAAGGYKVGAAQQVTDSNSLTPMLNEE